MASSPFIGLCCELCGKTSFGKWTVATELVLSVHPTFQMSVLQSCIKSRSHNDRPAVSTCQHFTRACPPEPALLSVPTIPGQPSCQNVPYLLSLHVFPTHSLVIPSQHSLYPQRPRGSGQCLQGVLLAPEARLSTLPSCFEASSQCPSGSAVTPALPGSLLSPLHLTLCSSPSLAWHPCLLLRHRSTLLWPSCVENPTDPGAPDLVGKEGGVGESCPTCGGFCLILGT